MPLYEFVCQQCRHLCEFLVRSSQAKIELVCPACGSAELQRVLSKVHSVVADGNAGGSPGSEKSPLEQRSCPSGSCSTITLPGHSR